MRRLLLCTALALPLPATAQEASLWDALHPDRILTQILQSIVGAARTQARITYGDLSLSIVQGRLSVADLAVSVPLGAGGGSCDVAVRSLDLTSDDPLSLVQVSGRVDLRGLDLSDGCLAAMDAAPLAAMLPGDGARVPAMTVEYDYDPRQSSLDLRTDARIEGLAALSLAAEMPYFWVRSDETGEPVVDADVSRVTLALDNLGGFEMAQAFLPPAATDPETAAAFLMQGMQPAFADMGDGGPLPKSAKTFMAALAEGWAAFVTDPKRLVIESGFDPADPRTVDAAFVARLQSGPLPVIELLEPTVGTTSAAERARLDPALVARGLEAPGALTGEEARSLGLAHLRGDRAPRFTGQALVLLGPLVEAGDTEVAMALAEALATTDAEAAYAMALAAGPGGMARLRPLLDRLEGNLPFATRLRLQSVTPLPTPADAAGPAAELRARAEAHLRGVGAARSLWHATYYGTIAAAEGDAEARALLGQIDRGVPIADQAAWADLRAEAEAAATAAWLDRQGG
ncbi:hypothetical protein [Jannaschia marina]|uniref:hypothetical protein n=1 Tax=Jannaschia marina TaxID=2741674 RepID=UPI0015C955A2|nr:hypothetical protein [Jannaschia marina]